MTTQRNFLDGPCQISQGFLLPFKNIRGSFGLPERLKIVLEQPADTPLFRDGVQIRMGGNPASENTPPPVFRQRQSGDFRLLHEARFFLTRKVSNRLAAYLPSPFVPFLPLMPLYLWNARSEAPSIPGVQRASAFWQDGSCVLQLPSCHEEPVSCSGKIMKKYILGVCCL